MTRRYEFVNVSTRSSEWTSEVIIGGWTTWESYGIVKWQKDRLTLSGSALKSVSLREFYTTTIR